MNFQDEKKKKERKQFYYFAEWLGAWSLKIFKPY